MFFDIIMRYSLKLQSIVQYFVVLRKFRKVPRQTNAYVSNKWLLKFPCAYLNTQGSGPFENPLKRIDDDIIMRYSLKLPSFVQYFVVLAMSIFLHFRSISNKLKKVVSIRVEMCIKSSIY
ncbi:hypothetical protein T12_719 [Trichinella patagoniensis]|uniref:Uncharacterized protein n=1 Tax=Trichinella patagoniensis TaxID=990121 RepID=A0A0V1A429_9BILA|nr:hypothetical protein T12_719 [Trichinella patagoniensis]